MENPTLFLLCRQSRLGLTTGLVPENCTVSWNTVTFMFQFYYRKQCYEWEIGFWLKAGYCTVSWMASICCPFPCSTAYAHGKEGLLVPHDAPSHPSRPQDYRSARLDSEAFSSMDLNCLLLIAVVIYIDTPQIEKKNSFQCCYPHIASSVFTLLWREAEQGNGWFSLNRAPLFVTTTAAAFEIKRTLWHPMTHHLGK